MTAAAPKRPRRPAFAAATVAGATLACLLLSEAAARLMRLAICTDHGTRYHRMNEDTGWSHEPNAHAVNAGCAGRRYEYRVAVGTNARGLCDQDYEYARTPGTGRVMVLGDSVAEATQVERTEGFPQLLEGLLSKPGRPVEVINTGVSGYCQVNQLLYWRSELRKYAPDVVVSEFNVQNDVFELSPALRPAWYTWPGGMPAAVVRVDQDGGLAVDTTPYRDAVRAAAHAERDGRSTPARLADEFYLLRRARSLLQPPRPSAQADASGPGPAEGVAGRPQASDAATDASAASEPRIQSEAALFLEPPPADWIEAWELVEAAYRTLRREVVTSGARLVVLVVPSKETVSDESWRGMTRLWGSPGEGRRWDREAPRRHILAILDRLGIPHADATNPMRAAATTGAGSGFYAVDPHPDPAGHRVLADTLAPLLASMLPGPSATAPAAGRR